ncbi:MAG: acyl-CoA dehydrogenase family protein [Ignavibacteriales bacterium]|nr:acyl-CoA dehydrogenase family protein [Ignavibacteriales bacterium]
MGAWGLTESSSGSDAAGLKSTAVKNGNQIYSKWQAKHLQLTVQSAETSVVMAITNKDAGKKGISAFILEKGMKGLIVGKKENKLGMRASDTVQLAFENCEVPAENLLGEEGMGFINAMQSLGRWKNFYCRCSVWFSTRLS